MGKKVTIIGILLVGMLIIGRGLFRYESNDKEVSTEEKIFSGIKVGEVVLLKDLGDYNQQTVFILYPYQEQVEGTAPEADRVNQYLRSIKIHFIGEDGYWALVLVDNPKVSITRFKRSSSADILEFHEVSDQVKQMIPNNFQPATWAKMDEAAFLMVNFRERRYLIFGRVRQ